MRRPKQGALGPLGCGLWLVLCLLAAPRAAAWAQPFEIAPDAEVTPRIGFSIQATLPSAVSPSEVHGFGAVLTGDVLYTDDLKTARLTIASASAHSVWRESRGRYEAGGLPTLTFFDLRAQYRLLPALHLLFGAALARRGLRTHARTGILCFDVGWALPIFGRNHQSMRDYSRFHLQLEARPLSVSWLSELSEEGLRNRDAPTAQAYGEVGVSGRLETRLGAFEGLTLLSFAYGHQHSAHWLSRVSWQAPALWSRVHPLVSVEYFWPLRPRRQHISDEAERLLYQRHLALSVGLIVPL